MNDNETNFEADAPNLEDLAEAAERESRAATTDDSAGSNDLLKLQAERNDALNRLARVQADFANSRRRLEAEFSQQMQYANKTLIKALLPAIDNFERALAVDSKVDAASVLKGLQLVHDQMMDVLKKQNVEIIAPAEGESFDPTRHEAVMQQENDQYSEPRILQCFQRGYSLHGQTIRPASVVVSKGS